MRKFILASFITLAMATQANASAIEQNCLRQIDPSQMADRGDLNPTDFKAVEQQFLKSGALSRIKGEMEKCLGQVGISDVHSLVAPSEMRDGAPGSFLQVIIGGKKEACIVTAEFYVAKKRLPGTTGALTRENSLRMPTFAFKPLICNFADAEEREI